MEAENSLLKWVIAFLIWSVHESWVTAFVFIMFNFLAETGSLTWYLRYMFFLNFSAKWRHVQFWYWHCEAHRNWRKSKMTVLFLAIFCIFLLVTGTSAIHGVIVVSRSLAGTQTGRPGTRGSLNWVRLTRNAVQSVWESIFAPLKKFSGQASSYNRNWVVDLRSTAPQFVTIIHFVA